MVAPGPRELTVAVPFLAYRIVGSLLVWAGCALVGSSLALSAADPDDGWARLGAGIWGLVWGAVLGVVGGIAFVFLRPPASPRKRWLVLGGLLLAAAIALTVLEALD